MAAKRPAKKKTDKSPAPVQETPVPKVPQKGTEAGGVPEVPAASEPASTPAAGPPAAPIQPEPAPAKPAAAGRMANATATQAKTFEVVVFTLGNEQFAIDLFDVKEVVEYTTITKLPNVPPYIKGIMDLRGEITTIIDLRKRLSLREDPGGVPENSRIIVLDNSVTSTKTGIHVDDVTSVSTFETTRVDYASGAMNNEDEAILGIIKKKVKVNDTETNELIIWLDIRKLIEDIEAD
ncbi:chemotaxis protein CheW [Methanoregula formicica]|uniref:Chemotaxis signal transduction protein n=1 Tax=Methanoregula formicica (strain DSM 22288 / NBRC 105244 / SMSP) TaxID=593750 RepID=L0HLG1_METFS|nr:chemotaxis protein CheW [Methanoregula formicica]AGB03899.1 chemotaxis signal transduction protein [Methanoregula formicica SMSP]